MRNSLFSRRRLGDFFIVLATILLIFIFYPIFALYFFPSLPVSANFDHYIKIPKINAYSEVIENVDPWNKNEYGEALKKGVAQAKGYENYLFAHSSLPPWEMTRTNTAFLRLGELKIGDQIIIHKNGRDLIYIVQDKKEVWPDQVNFIAKADKDNLILQTCAPLGTAFKRLLIIASPSIKALGAT